MFLHMFSCTFFYVTKNRYETGNFSSLFSTGIHLFVLPPLNQFIKMLKRYIRSIKSSNKIFNFHKFSEKQTHLDSGQ